MGALSGAPFLSRLLMPGDRYYQTTAWRTLRERALSRDGRICVTPNCGAPAKVVDHIIPRREGGRDDLVNLRSLCRSCDNRRHGRKSVDTGAGRLEALGCDVDGLPRSAGHWWAK
jgi:5-methylcytosine-specific restriction endonuclease McrA